MVTKSYSFIHIYTLKQIFISTETLANVRSHSQKQIKLVHKYIKDHTQIRTHAHTNTKLHAHTLLHPTRIS